jgi:hypothetical protein
MGVQHLTALLGVVYTTCTNAKGETVDTTVWLYPVTDNRGDTCIDPGENAAPPTKAHIHLKEPLSLNAKVCLCPLMNHRWKPTP